MERDIIRTLEQEIGRLTKSQKRVAAYIIKSPMEAAFSTIDQLAHKVDTSTTTIVRLALHLGFSGYTEFQRELQEYLKSRTPPSTKLEVGFQEQQGKNDIIKGIANQEIGNLTKTFERLSDGQIKEAVAFLKEAKRRFVFGSRSCFSVAHFLCYNLTRIFGDCTLCSDNGELCEQINDMNQDDVLIAITLPRYVRRVVETAEFAKERGVSVIAVTDGHLSPLANYADILFPVECKTTGFHNSLTSAMLIAELLIGVSTKENVKRVKTNLSESEKLLRRMQVHCL